MLMRVENGPEIRNPTLSDIQRVFDLLDEEVHRYVVIEDDEQRFLQVMRGPGAKLIVEANFTGHDGMVKRAQDVRSLHRVMEAFEYFSLRNPSWKTLWRWNGFESQGQGISLPSKIMLLLFVLLTVLILVLSAIL